MSHVALRHGTVGNPDVAHIVVDRCFVIDGAESLDGPLNLPTSNVAFRALA